MQLRCRVARLRLAIATIALVMLVRASLDIKLRRTAWSCRSVSSCAGLENRHESSYRSSSTPNTRAEIDLTDHYFWRATHANSDILILVLTKDATSWSRDFRSAQRTVFDMLDLLLATQLDLTSVSIAMMTSSPQEFVKMKSAAHSLPFAGIYIRLHSDWDAGFAYEDRHNPIVQQARRSSIAKSRNFLMRSALRSEKHLVWIDADVVEISVGVVQKMIHHSNNDSHASIITVLCHQNQMINYDKNAWRLDAPHLLGPIADAEREESARGLKETAIMAPELINGTDDEELVALDSVGATLLYIRADLVQQGLVFPYWNTVGTTWNTFGWVGLESEGLCYLAKGLTNGGCYILGGTHHARHADWG